MRGRLYLVAFMLVGGSASADDLIAVKPGVMCSSSDALGKLTLPNGSSRSAVNGASPLYSAIKQEGGCIDISLGSRVHVLTARRQTTLVTYNDPDGSGPRQFIIANIDFQPVSEAQQSEQTPGASPDASHNIHLRTKTSNILQSDDRLNILPILDSLTIAFLYAKLTNATPDFVSYAENTERYKKANTFDQEAVLTQEESRMKQLYDQLNQSNSYLFRVNVELRQYDSSVGGYALGWDGATFLPFSDPVNRLQYALHLSNEQEFSVISMPNSDRAREFARRFTFDTAPNSTNSVVYEITLQVREALPSTSLDQLSLRGVILAAKIRASDGRLIYEFPVVAAANGSDSALPMADRTANVDVQGIRLGMPATDAEAIGKRGWMLESEATNYTGEIFVNAPDPSQKWISCGGLNNLNFDQRVSVDPMLLASGGDTTDCIAYQSSSRGADAKVLSVFSRQILKTPLDQLRKSLIAKYGTPTKAGTGNPDIYDTKKREITSLTWVVGNSNPSLQSLTISAGLGSIASDRNWMSVSIVPYVDPNAKALLPPVSGAPKL